MKLRLTTFTLFILSTTTTVFGQQAKIEGYVSDDRDRRISGVRIVVTPGGQAGITDNKGHFIVSLPHNIKPGQAARIIVKRPRWVIFNPMFGNCDTKDEARNYEPLPVVIVRKGSLLALSPKRISEVVAQWASERRNYAQDNESLRGEVSRLNREADEYAFLRKYAKEYGFTLEKFITAANQWARIKDSDDKKERALKEYWNKNYDSAAQLALEAAKDAEPELDRANQQKSEASRRIILIYVVRGGSFNEQGKFAEALDAFQKIEKYFESGRLDKEAFADERAKVKIFAADVRIALSKRTEGADKKRLLLEAVPAFEQGVAFYTSGEFSEAWGFVRERLGDVMFGLGELTEGAESIEYFKRALAAYTALEVFTRQQSRREWALIQSKLGTVLDELGRKATGAERLNYLNKAATAYNEALKVFAQLHAQEDWGMAETNLGNIMHDLGEITEGRESIEYFNKAVVAYNNALKVFTQQQSPEEWAMTNYNLGNSLLDLGERTAGEESVSYLNKAIKAYRFALAVRNFQKSPRQWLKTQRNLALAYLALNDLNSASEAFASILQADPDNREAYYKATAIYHQMLFNFEKALALNQQWLAQHKDDIGAQFIFVESHFTTARFTECLQLINSLLARSDYPINAKTALRTLEIASLLALNQTEQVSVKLDALIAEVANQLPTYKVEWGYEGTRYFIGHNEKLLPHRVWLAQLLDAIASEDRDKILKALQEVRTKWKK